MAQLYALSLSPLASNFSLRIHGTQGVPIFQNLAFPVRKCIYVLAFTEARIAVLV